MSETVVIKHRDGRYSLFPYDDCAWFKNIEKIGFDRFEFKNYICNVKCDKMCSVNTHGSTNIEIFKILNDKNYALLNIKSETNPSIRGWCEACLKGFRLIELLKMNQSY
jgi:hypothetical protein